LTGLICLRIGTGGRLLWTRWWTFSLRNILGVCWHSEYLLASEGLCLMELAGWCFERPPKCPATANVMNCVGTFECACAVDQVLLPPIIWCVLCCLVSDVEVNCFNDNFKIYIKIDIKTAPTCFGAVTPSSGIALLVLAEVTVVKIAN
jgi:hypothetical protein